MNEAELILPAPAKVNLRLRILAREASGFHQLETLFATIALADELHLRVERHGIRLEVEGADLGPVEDNLVARAARAFLAACPEDALRRGRGVDVRLIKRIPAGAGLGGGSSDAASTLRGLNRLHGGPLEPKALNELGAELGSDVPFFLSGSSFALGWGRGEQILALPPLPPAPILLAVPDFRIATSDAYRTLAEGRATSGNLPSPNAWQLSDFESWDEVVDLASNDFETALFPRYPRLADIRDRLRAHGAIIARLSGSGSAVFGVFESEKIRDRARDALLPERDLSLISTTAAADPRR